MPSLRCLLWVCSSCKSPRLRAGSVCNLLQVFPLIPHTVGGHRIPNASCTREDKPPLIKTVTVQLQSTWGDGGISSEEKILNVTTLTKRRIYYVGVYSLWVSQCEILFAEREWVHVQYRAEVDGSQGVGNCSFWEYFRAGWPAVLAHLFLSLPKACVDSRSVNSRAREAWSVTAAAGEDAPSGSQLVSCLASKARISLGYGWASPRQDCEPQAALASLPPFLPMGTKCIDFWLYFKHSWRIQFHSLQVRWSFLLYLPCLLLKTNFDPDLTFLFFDRVRKIILNPSLLLMASLSPSLMWPNLVCASSAPWDWVRCLHRRYREFGLCQWCISKRRSRTASFPTLSMTGFPVQPLTARLLQPQKSQESLLHLFCFDLFLSVFILFVGIFFLRSVCSPSFVLVYLLTLSELFQRAIFLLLNPLFVKSMVWYRSLEPCLQAQLERRARAGQALFVQELLTARYIITQESPPVLLWSSGLWKWVLEMELNGKVTSSAEHQQVRTSDATLTFLMQLLFRTAR